MKFPVRNQFMQVNYPLGLKNNWSRVMIWTLMCLVFIKVLRQSLSSVGEKSSTTLVHNKKQIEEKTNDR